MSRRKVSACIAVAIVCYARNAGADEPEPDAGASPVRLLSEARCTTEAGSALTLPPGRYLPEPVWASLDVEVRRLQDAETRLAAENAVLRKPREDRGRWVLAGLAFSAGISVGLWASR